MLLRTTGGGSHNSSGVARRTRSKNVRRCLVLPPYAPASLSVVYSRIFRRASGGSCGDNNMRLMIPAERPEPLWLALRMVQVVLRASPSAFDCSSSVKNPESTRACLSSLIFAVCRAFISVMMGLLLSFWLLERPCVIMLLREEGPGQGGTERE